MTHHFRVPEQFSWLLNPIVCLQQSPFWLILIRFMVYYLPFCCPIEISTINDPWGVSTCRYSTLAVLADPCMFHKLLLTVLGSRSYFHGCFNPIVRLRFVQQFPSVWPILAFRRLLLTVGD